MNKIKSLQRGVCNSLRSSVILFDLPRVVEELTCNSLDSGATKVYISINVRACYVKVEDDGCGVTRDDLLILGERYATSKIHFLMDMETNNEGFGFRGEAIASLSDVSLVEIRTKARGMPNAYCKIIKGSKCLSFGIDDLREVFGTTVVVRDLFYNQPVRRNYMQTSPKRVLHSIKKSVLRIALVHPQVLLKVTDIESEDELLCTVPSSSPLPLVSDAFGEEVSTSLEEVLFSDQVLTLSGYLSRMTHAFSTKAFQYIYINSRFVCKGPIHNLLNKLAASIQCSLPHCEIEPEVQTGKRRKTQAAYPAFLLNFFCPLSSYDLHFEPSKTLVEFKDWSTVFAFFEQAMKQFWKQVSEKPLQGLSKSSKMKDAECDNKLHQNIPSNSSVTCPLDISLENIGTCHKKELPSEEMRRSSWLKPCQRNAGCLDHAGCSSQLRFNDSLANFGYPHAQLGYANSDKQCFAGVSSCLLEDNIISDQAPSFGDRYGMSDRERRNNILDVSGDSGRLQKRTVDILLNFHPFDIIDNVENIQFPESCFAENERSHSPGYKKGHTKSDTNQHSLDVGFDSLVKFSPFYDTADNAEADNGFSVWHTQVQEKDSTCRPSTSVIGKCQENYDLEVPSNGRMDSFSCGEAPFYKKDKLDDALVSAFLVDGPKSGFLQLDWCLDEPQLSAKRLKSDARICDSRGCLPSFARTISGYSGSIENVKIINSLQDSSDDVFPAKYTKTELDFQFDFSPMSNMQYPSLSNQNAFGKVSPLSLFNNETSWSPSESSNMTNAEIYSKHRSSMQIQDEGCQSFQDELDLQNSRLSKVYKVRSRRSCSAPPFYEGKHRFSTINDHLTTTAEKGSTSHVPDVSNVEQETISPVNYLSQPPSSSQPCFKPNVNEISQTLSRVRKRTGEKVSSLQMDETQNDGEVSEVEGSIAKLEYALAIPTKWRTGIPQSTDRDISHTSKDNVLSISSGILHLSASSLIPDSINKGCLQNARVLQQLDKKFIPVMAGQILVIVDQTTLRRILAPQRWEQYTVGNFVFFLHLYKKHAADERIRLEDLRQKVLSGEGNSVTYLDSEQELVLPEMGYQLLQKYTDQIRNWGWICNIHNQCSDSFTKNVNILKRRKCNITLVAVPCILGINLNEKDLIEFIEQLVETDGSSIIPPAVIRILNFKACRGAIMFGDSLLPSECALILEELKATSLCFQCAHGRPTTVPLLNVASLHEQLRVLEVEKGGGAGETWHRLSQHKPSIKRAQMRLESAKRFQGG